MRKIAGMTMMAGLVALALSAPVAQAQTDPIPRGGELKCANNLPADLIEGASATLVWTVTTGGTTTTTGTPATFGCNTTTIPVETKPVSQPADANGWSLVITIFGPLVPNPLPPPDQFRFTFTCDPDIGTFDAGGVPHIRLRCVNPNGGGAVTFSLSRNP
jgi:hypothetical protein